MSDIHDILPGATKESLGRLEIKARKVVGGLLHGAHRSRKLGVSTDFSHHKPYQHGDVIRHIDWRVSARSDSYFVKRFREDSSLNVHILVDLSGSMCGTSFTPTTKAMHALSLAAAMAYLVSNQGDRVSLGAVSQNASTVLPLGSSDRHLVALLSALLAHPVGGGDELVRHLAAMSGRNLARGIVFFISDLMFDPDPVRKELSTLHHQGHEVLCAIVRDRTEEEFPYNQWVRFIDGEKRYPTVKVDAVVLGRLYREEYARIMSEWRDWATRNDIHCIDSFSHEGAETTLVAYLRHRTHLMGGRA
jgi:uncharacterized protein (DUF58 family)